MIYSMRRPTLLQLAADFMLSKPTKA